jgi:CRP-like cAMP-binding protein
MAATAPLTTPSTWDSGAAAAPAWAGSDPRAVRAGARLLEADPDLGRALEPAVRERLSPLLRVRIESLPAGAWRPPKDVLAAGGLGLLVLEGLVLRDLSVHGRCCAEVLGPGDLLRPDGTEEPAMAELEWQIVEGPARVAVLDRRASIILGRFPVLVSELLERGLGRARMLQYQLALTQIHGIDQRLQLLLWQLAERWGRVTLDGVVVPLRLTHEMLGRLIGARRPSVTTALRRLGEEGTVLRHTDGWLLTSHEPPPPCSVN